MPDPLPPPLTHGTQVSGTCPVPTPPLSGPIHPPHLPLLGPYRSYCPALVHNATPHASTYSAHTPPAPTTPAGPIQAHSAQQWSILAPSDQRGLTGTSKPSIHPPASLLGPYRSLVTALVQTSPFWPPVTKDPPIHPQAPSTGPIWVHSAQDWSILASSKQRGPPRCPQHIILPPTSLPLSPYGSIVTCTSPYWLPVTGTLVTRDTSCSLWQVHTPSASPTAGSLVPRTGPYLP